MVGLYENLKNIYPFYSICISLFLFFIIEAEEINAYTMYRNTKNTKYEPNILLRHFSLPSALHFNISWRYLFIESGSADANKRPDYISNGP